VTRFFHSGPDLVWGGTLFSTLNGPMHRAIVIPLSLYFLFGSALALRAADKKSPLEKARIELLNLHNKERKKKKLAELTMNDKLESAAQQYAEFMAESGKFGHNEQGTPEERIKAAGYEAMAGGENLAWGLPNAGRVVREWMKSDVHRDNILMEDFAEVGFGIAPNAKGELYWVTNFGAPKEKAEEAPGESKDSPPR